MKNKIGICDLSGSPCNGYSYYCLHFRYALYSKRNQYCPHFQKPAFTKETAVP